MLSRSHPEYQYLNLLKETLTKGIRKVDRGTGDASYSLFGKQIRFDLSQGFPLLTTKKVYWKGVLYELYWFISGQSNIKYLVDNNVHIWDDYPYKIYKLKVKSEKLKVLTKEEFIEKIKTDEKFAKKWGNLPKIYGELWRRWPTKTKRTIDQLKWAINELIEDPNCHNAIVTSWNPEYLYTMAAFKDTSHFPICHNMYQLNVNNHQLSLHLYQRSADLFLGVPFNIGSYALLTLIIAKITGYQPGEFIHTFGDAHIYEQHFPQVKEQLKRKPRPFPKIKFSHNFKDIDEFKPEYVLLENYHPHPPIKANLSVSGGYYQKRVPMKKPKISIIVAIDESGGIGKNNQIPWRIPQDLKRFKKLTKNHVVIMGRKTFESIGKPLPNRINIIITANKTYKLMPYYDSINQLIKTIICHSVEQAIKIAQRYEKSNGEIFIIGGSQIYQQAIKYTDKLYLTIVNGKYDADTFFPDHSQFKKKIFEKKGKSGGYKYRFVELEK